MTRLMGWGKASPAVVLLTSVDRCVTWGCIGLLIFHSLNQKYPRGLYAFKLLKTFRSLSIHTTLLMDAHRRHTRWSIHCCTCFTHQNGWRRSLVVRVNMCTVLSCLSADRLRRRLASIVHDIILLYSTINILLCKCFQIKVHRGGGSRASAAGAALGFHPRGLWALESRAWESSYVTGSYVIIADQVCFVLLRGEI